MGRQARCRRYTALRRDSRKPTNCELQTRQCGLGGSPLKIIFLCVASTTSLTVKLNEATHSGAGERRKICHACREQAANKFWRSLGFQQTGTTDWLALINDTDTIGDVGDINAPAPDPQNLIADTYLSPSMAMLLRVLRFGCDCGRCCSGITGFISTRMRFTLGTQAETWHNKLQEKGWQDWAENHEPALRFVPAEALDA